jgi:undecaprenyl-diphosphatase
MRAAPGRPSTRRHVAVIGVIGIIATLAAASTLDIASISWGPALPDGVVSFFAFLTRYGQSDWILIPTGLFVILLLLCNWSRIDRRVAAAWTEIGTLATTLFVAVAGSGLTVDLIKVIIGRERPLRFGMDGAFAFDPFSFQYATNSFPSGHSTTAGAVAVTALLISRRAGGIVFFFAILIALSRIVVGAHYPSDVTAGFLFGASYAYFLAVGFSKGRIGFSMGSRNIPRPRWIAIRRVFARPGCARLMVLGLLSALVGRHMPDPSRQSARLAPSTEGKDAHDR